MAEDDRRDDILRNHEGRISILEEHRRGTEERLAAGAKRMDLLGQTSEAIRTELRDWGARTVAETDASNKRVEARVEALSRPWPTWLRAAVSFIGVGGAVAAVQLVVYLARQPTPEQMEQATRSLHAVEIQQAEQRKDTESLKDSAARQEAALRQLDTMIRGVAPGKAGTP